MELHEKFEHPGRCKLPLSEWEVAMPRARAGFMHDNSVPRLLRTIDHLHGSRNAERVVLEKFGHPVLWL